MCFLIQTQQAPSPVIVPDAAEVTAVGHAPDHPVDDPMPLSAAPYPEVPFRGTCPRPRISTKIGHGTPPPGGGTPFLVAILKYSQFLHSRPEAAVNRDQTPPEPVSCVILKPMSSQPRSRPAALGVEIAAKLREALARRQVTQAELGKRVGISTSQISLYLRGKRSMSIDEFANICGALDLIADEIFSQAFLLTRPQHAESP